MKKLLYITNSINGSGGLERILALKTNYFINRFGYEIHIIVLNGGYQNAFFTFNPNIHFHSVKIQGNIFSKLIRYRNGIKQVIAEIHPDIISVCDDGFKGLFFSLIFGKKHPVIYERHASIDLHANQKNINFITSIKFKILKYLFLIGAKKFDKFIVLTKGSIKEWNLQNMMVIPNSLTFYPNKVSKLTSKKLIAVGSHNYNKGFDRLIDIWQKIHQLKPDWVLEVYGKKSKSFDLEKMIKLKKLEKTVLLYDPVKDIEKQYLEASIFVLPSRSEGFGLVLIEAMSCGLPSVVFDCPSGPADIINNKEDGFLISDGNLSDFEQKLLSLMDSIDLRKKMGAAARENVKRFTIENIAKKWDNLFNELLNK